MFDFIRFICLVFIVCFHLPSCAYSLDNTANIRATQATGSRWDILIHSSDNSPDNSTRERREPEGFMILDDDYVIEDDYYPEEVDSDADIGTLVLEQASRLVGRSPAKQMEEIDDINRIPVSETLIRRNLSLIHQNNTKNWHRSRDIESPGENRTGQKSFGIEELESETSNEERILTMDYDLEGPQGITIQIINTLPDPSSIPQQPLSYNPHPSNNNQPERSDQQVAIQPLMQPVFTNPILTPIRIPSVVSPVVQAVPPIIPPVVQPVAVAIPPVVSPVVRPVATVMPLKITRVRPTIMIPIF